MSPAHRFPFLWLRIWRPGGQLGDRPERQCLSLSVPTLSDLARGRADAGEGLASLTQNRQLSKDRALLSGESAP